MTVDLDAPIQWVLPEPQPFSRVAGWLNVELMKNLAEINQIGLLCADMESIDPDTIRVQQ